MQEAITGYHKDEPKVPRVAGPRAGGVTYPARTTSTSTISSSPGATANSWIRSVELPLVTF